MRWELLVMKASSLLDRVKSLETFVNELQHKCTKVLVRGSHDELFPVTTPIYPGILSLLDFHGE